jgi:hypothetical protein
MSISAPVRSGALPRTDLESAARGRQDPSAQRRGITGTPQAPAQVIASRLEQTQRQPAMPRGSYIDILA